MEQDEIKKYTKLKKVITIPELQISFSLSYKEAREIVQKFIKDNVLEYIGDIRYRYLPPKQKKSSSNKSSKLLPIEEENVILMAEDEIQYLQWGKKVAKNGITVHNLEIYLGIEFDQATYALSYLESRGYCKGGFTETCGQLLVPISKFAQDILTIQKNQKKIENQFTKEDFLKMKIKQDASDDGYIYSRLGEYFYRSSDIEMSYLLKKKENNLWIGDHQETFRIISQKLPNLRSDEIIKMIKTSIPFSDIPFEEKEISFMSSSFDEFEKMINRLNEIISTILRDIV